MEIMYAADGKQLYATGGELQESGLTCGIQGDEETSQGSLS